MPERVLARPAGKPARKPGLALAVCASVSWNMPGPAVRGISNVQMIDKIDDRWIDKIKMIETLCWRGPA